ncbi:unnamed protein product [Acidithrix sp. C25]|nr:unnamed protein product [Acidithrix sp. C25]
MGTIRSKGWTLYVKNLFYNRRTVSDSVSVITAKTRATSPF